MAIYDWREFENSPWSNRYPDHVRGVNLWREYWRGQELVRRLALERRSAPTAKSPCVFVSHRQCDVDLALRVAELACRRGFDYWLDVLDPRLVQPAGAPPVSSPVAIAGTIEMALLNSTHVVAVLTKDTAGSQWVPYEYGRVKEPMVVSARAACWLDPFMRTQTVAEYLHLGEITRSEQNLDAWLDREGKAMGVFAGRCSWKHPPTIPLP